MPIIGLTGRGARFDQIGKLFKGDRKQKKTNSDGKEYETFGQEREYWRFESDFPAVRAAFYQTFGDKPQSLPVYLPFPTADENFQACKEAYTAGGLQHRCDGEVCSVWFDSKSNLYRTTPVPCPTLKMSEAEAKRNGCKEIGRLQVFIPALGEIGFVTVETHSKNDILNLDQRLPALARLHPEGLTKIPMTLYRYEEAISTPRGDKRVRVNKWLIGLKPMTEWAGRYLSATQRALLSERFEPQARALSAGNPPLVEDDDDDLDDGGMPEMQAEPPKRPALTAVARPTEAAPSSLDAFLLAKSVEKKKSDKAGQAWFDAMYAKLSSEKKQQAAIDLGWKPEVDADDSDVIDGEVVDTDPRLQLCVDIEELCRKLTAAGVKMQRQNALQKGIAVAQMTTEQLIAYKVALATELNEAGERMAA